MKSEHDVFSRPMELPESKAEVRWRHGIKFDGTINAGHVATIVVLMVTGMTAWNGFDKRILVLEEARTVQRERDIEISGRLDKIDLRLERIADQLNQQRNPK